MSRLTGKVALVTGASRGIGAATARRAAGGAAEGVVRTSRDAGGEAVAIAADLSDAAQVAPLIDAALKPFGKLDILVNNAAVSEPRMLDESDVEHYAKHFDLN